MKLTPEDLDQLYALGFSSFDDAMRFLTDKGYQVTWDWREQIDMNHAQVFTVAKVVKMDILQSIRDELEKSMRAGLGYAGFKKNIEPILKRKGWWGKGLGPDGKEVVLGTPWRLRTIYKTNLQSSFMAGRWEGFEQNREERPYLQYIAVMDNNTRPEHAALNGVIRHIDDPFWRTFMPPNGYSCRCRARSLTAEDAGREGYKEVPQGIMPDEGFRQNVGKRDYRAKKTDYSPDIWEAANK